MARAPRDRRPTEAPGGGTAPTLASLHDDLGPDLLAITLAPRGLDVAIAEPVVHGPDELLAADEGDVILAVGLDAGGSGARELVAAARDRGAAAVVLRRRGPVAKRLADTARECGVALLSTPAGFPWGQLYALIRTSAAAAARRSPTGISDTTIGDLSALADAIAAAAGGPVTIEDPQSRVLAFSKLDGPIDRAREATILARQVPDDWLRLLDDSGVLQRLRQSDDVVHVEFPGESAPRYAIAVRAGGALIGSIWLAEGRRPLDETTEAVLEEAARMAALHLLRHQLSDDLARCVRGELLRTLLAGEAQPDVVARELGLPPGAAIAVVAVSTREPAADEPSALVVEERIVNLIAVYFQSFRRTALVAALDGHVHVLVAVQHGDSRERFVALTRDAIENAAKACGVRLRAGVGPAVTSLAEIPASRAGADQALRIGARDRLSASVVDIEDVRGLALVLDVAEALGDAPRPRSRELALLEQHDREHGTGYVKTLRVYLDAFGNPALAAQRLALHPNTVRYRMRRIAELAGVDLSDPDSRFPLELELRLLE